MDIGVQKGSQDVQSDCEKFRDLENKKRDGGAECGVAGAVGAVGAVGDDGDVKRGKMGAGCSAGE